MCENEVKSHRTYCSNPCKFSDKEYNQGRKPTIKNNPNLIARCKVDGKTLNDVNNLGGHLSSYSKNNLNKEFDWNDWEIIDKPEVEHWNCPYCDWKGKAQNGLDGGGWIGKHLEKVHNLTKDAHVEQFPIDSKLWPNKLKVIAQKKFINSDVDNQVKCLECGELFMKISNTHLSKHNMSLQEYKLKYPNAQVESVELNTRYL